MSLRDDVVLTVLSASTRDQVQVAQRVARAWLHEHPTDDDFMEACEQLEMTASALGLEMALKHLGAGDSREGGHDQSSHSPKKVGTIDAKAPLDTVSTDTVTEKNMKAVSKEMEKITGTESRWNGMLWKWSIPHAGAKEPDCSIELDEDYASGPGGGHTAVHELFHALSSYETSDLYERIGWEEGVVEKMAQLHGKDLFKLLSGGNEETEARWAKFVDEVDKRGDDPYQPYVDVMEDLRELSGMDEKNFYKQMIQIPVGERPDKVRNLVGKDNEKAVDEAVELLKMDYIGLRRHKEAEKRKKDREREIAEADARVEAGRERRARGFFTAQEARQFAYNEIGNMGKDEDYEDFKVRLAEAAEKRLAELEASGKLVKE